MTATEESIFPLAHTVSILKRRWTVGVCNLSIVQIRYPSHTYVASHAHKQYPELLVQSVNIYVLVSTNFCLRIKLLVIHPFDYLEPIHSLIPQDLRHKLNWVLSCTSKWPKVLALQNCFLILLSTGMCNWKSCNFPIPMKHFGYLDVSVLLKPSVSMQH